MICGQISRSGFTLNLIWKSCGSCADYVEDTLRGGKRARGLIYELKGDKLISGCWLANCYSSEKVVTFRWSDINGLLKRKVKHMAELVYE